MVSPPLAEGLDIPLDQYDEWYFLDEPPHHEWRPEVFVNYGGFTLVAIEEIYKTSTRHGTGTGSITWCRFRSGSGRRWSESIPSRTSRWATKMSSSRTARVIEQLQASE